MRAEVECIGKGKAHRPYEFGVKVSVATTVKHSARRADRDVRERTMPGPILHVGDTMICPHGGQVTTVPGSPRVMVSGMPVATMADTYLVAGCVFTVGPKPQPCVKVLWLVPAARVQVMGQPVIIQTSVGLCQSAERIPQGPPSVIVAQTRAIAT